MTLASGSTDAGARELRWVDAFSWLDTAARDTPQLDIDFGWWNEPVTPALRSVNLSRVAGLALERLTTWTIGQIFPGLPSGTELAALDFPTRVRNMLLRLGYSCAGEIQPLTLNEVLDWPNIGVGSVQALLRTLASQSLVAVEPLQLVRPLRTSSDAFESEDDFDPTDVTWRWGTTAQEKAWLDDLETVARWLSFVGHDETAVLGDTEEITMPPRIGDALSRLRSLTAADFFKELSVEHGAGSVVSRVLDEFEPRVQEVLSRRLFADVADTLDDIGRSLGVTRERVRQIEGKARAQLFAFIEPGGPLAELGELVRSRVKGLTPLQLLLEQIPSLASTVPSVGWPVWRIIDRLDDSYEIVDGWCAAPSLSGIQTVTQSRLQDLADAYGVVRLDEIERLGSGPTVDVAPEVLQQWLLYCGFEISGSFVLTRTGSVTDRAAAVLSIAGAPMSAQQILDRFTVERSLGSLKNAMMGDERIMRVDRDRWALVEWGHESYGSIRQVIGRLVADRGGEVPLDDLIASITSRFNVSPNSVTAYANAHPFECTKGVVHVARGDKVARRAPQRTRRLYRRADAWVYRITVTSDHLRGSGSVAPIAVATIADVEPGTTVFRESRLGPQAIAWTGIQPSFGTLRRFLTADDLSAGDDVFCVLFDSGNFDLERMRALSGGPINDAVALVGGPQTQTALEALAALRAALDLPANSTVATVIGAFRERGDLDVADLITAGREGLTDGPHQGPDTATDIDDILSLL